MKTFASALAAAAAIGVASSAQAATFQLDDTTEFSVYGNIQLRYEIVTQADGEDASRFTDGGSTIGFDAAHTFNNGLTAFGKAEFEHDADDKASGGGLDTTDQAFLGLRGGFGEVQAGSFDSIYSDAIYDLTDPFEDVSFSTPGEFDPDSPEGDTIAYTSPSWGGFSFQVAGRIGGELDTGADSEEIGFAAVVSYTVGDLIVNAGYDERGSNSVDLDGDGNADVFDDGSAYGIGAVYSLGDAYVAGRYEIYEDFEGEDETTAIAAVVGYDYGMGDIYGGVHELDPDNGDSRTEFSIGVNYSIVDNMYVFTEYGMRDRDNDEGDLFQVGAVYSF